MFEDFFHRSVFPGLLFLSLTLFTACNDSGLNPENSLPVKNDISEIQYGTSFGMCKGYCLKTVEIIPGTLKYRKEGWSEEIPDITCQTDFTPAQFSNLTAKINPEGFFQLDETIGCPDCADGGAEWIEIRTPDLVHKVTFEYMEAPSIVGNYIDELRIILSEADDCRE